MMIAMSPPPSPWGPGDWSGIKYRLGKARIELVGRSVPVRSKVARRRDKHVRNGWLVS
jgi:hypothetical protein